MFDDIFLSSPLHIFEQKISTGSVSLYFLRAYAELISFIIIDKYCALLQNIYTEMREENIMEENSSRNCPHVFTIHTQQ